MVNSIPTTPKILMGCHVACIDIFRGFMKSITCIDQGATKM